MFNLFDRDSRPIKANKKYLVSRKEEAVKKILLLIVLGFLVYHFGIREHLNFDVGPIQLTLIDGEHSEDVTIRLNNHFELDVVEHTGYVFMGWFTEEVGGVRLTDEQGRSINVASRDMVKTLYAQFEEKVFHIALDNNIITSLSITYNNTLPNFPLPEGSVPLGKEFIGYRIKDSNILITNSNGTPLTEYMTLNESNLDDFYAEEGIFYLESVFAYKSYLINYFVNNELESSIGYTFNDTVIDHPHLIKPNQLFIGWYRDALLTQKVEGATLLNDLSLELNLYARFLDTTPDVLLFESIKGDTEYRVHLATNTLSQIVIPEEYFGKPVTEIGDFSSCIAAQIHIPHSIKSIAEGAFKSCEQLVHFRWPSNVSVIPNQVFKNAYSLESIILPDNVVRIDEEAFLNARSLTTFNIPRNLTHLAENAFIGTLSLESFTLSEGNQLFEVNEGVLFIKKGPFRVLLVYPSSKTDSFYSIPVFVQEIASYAFYQAKYLTQITLHDSIYKLGDYAFYNLKNLRLVNLSMNRLHPGFTFGDHVFKSNPSLKTVIIHNLVPLEITDQTFASTSAHLKIYVPTQSLTNYQNSPSWALYHDQLFPRSLIFGDYIVEEVTINGVEGYKIVHYMGNETHINIPEVINAKAIISLGYQSFANLSYLETIVLPSQLLAIEDFAFNESTQLREVYLKPILPPTLGDHVFKETHTAMYIYIMSNDLEHLDNYKNAPGWEDYEERIFTDN